MNPWGNSVWGWSNITRSIRRGLPMSITNHIHGFCLTARVLQLVNRRASIALCASLA